MTLPSIFSFSKITGFIVANKLAVAGVAVGVAIVVPATVYVANKPSADQQTSTEQVAQEVKGNDNITVPVEGTSNSQPTDNQQTSNQNSNNTQQTTSNQTPTTSSNPTSNEQPSNTTPTPNNQAPTTPTPAPPTVDWWDIVVTSYSPTSCGVTTSNQCPLGTAVSVNVSFYDRNTGEPITITSCSAEGTIGSGPSYLTANGGARFPTQTNMTSNKTCTSTFTPPDYGRYGIWLTATTTESPNHPQMTNNTKYWYIKP